MKRSNSFWNNQIGCYFVQVVWKLCCYLLYRFGNVLPLVWPEWRTFFILYSAPLYGSPKIKTLSNFKVIFAKKIKKKKTSLSNFLSVWHLLNKQNKKTNFQIIHICQNWKFTSVFYFKKSSWKRDGGKNSLIFKKNFVKTWPDDNKTSLNGVNC